MTRISDEKEERPVKLAAAAAIALAFATPGDAAERPSVAPQAMQDIAPALADYTDTILFGDVWTRPGLSPRDRSLVTLSVLIATGKTAQIGSHLNRGLSNGVTPTEVAGMVTQLAFYTGWPNAVSALPVIEKTFADRKIDTRALRTLDPARLPVPASDGARAETAIAQVAPIAPKLAELTNNLLFGDLWRRTDLAPRDRSLVTIAALAANGDVDQLPFHVRLGLQNGLTRAEIGEAFTHLAFYAGWPEAMAAVAATKAVLTEQTGKAMTTDPGVRVIAPGTALTPAMPANFTGSASVTSAFKGTGEARLDGGTVTFQPGARTNWHRHPLGQLLVVTDGQGWVQAEGEPVQAIKPGETVWIGPGVKHWHGATRGHAMTHVAISEASDGTSVTWLEPVSDDQYYGPQ